MVQLRIGRKRGFYWFKNQFFFLLELDEVIRRCWVCLYLAGFNSFFNVYFYSVCLFRGFFQVFGFVLGFFKYCCWTSLVLSFDKEVIKDEFGEFIVRCGCSSVSRVFLVRGARDFFWLVGNYFSCWMEIGYWGGQGVGGFLRLSLVFYLIVEEIEVRSLKF